MSIQNRKHKDIYIFLHDDNKRFHHVEYVVSEFGERTPVLKSSTPPIPITNNPANLLENNLQFATNSKYFSLNRSITYPLEFIKDGAFILRNLYYNGRGIEQNTYMIILEWNGNTNLYELSYRGRINYSTFRDDPKLDTVSISIVDDSAWGILSQNDDVEYSIDCSPSNPKAVRVLMDGITLVNKATFQTVQAAMPNGGGRRTPLPFVLVHQDGDSAGIILQSGITGNYTTEAELFDSAAYFLRTMYPVNGVNINGSIKFRFDLQSGSRPSFIIQLRTNFGKRLDIFQSLVTNNQVTVVSGNVYTADFNVTWDLAADERVFLTIEMFVFSTQYTITPIVTNSTVLIKTKAQPQIVYGLRPLDLLQEIVSKATFGRFTINSEFFKENNKSICLSGDALRGIPNAKIFTSFQDFFKTFDAINFMALKSIGNQLWMEKATEVYKLTDDIIDLGEILDIKLTPATEYYANEILVGSPKQDLRHPSGRLEFNSTNTFSMPFKNIDKKLDIVSKYRLGCYDPTFLIMDYNADSTIDNNGDKSVYVLDITDELGTAVDNIETFELVTINNAHLNPVIKNPRNNDYVNNSRPTIRGIASPLTDVNIYADGAFVGTTTSFSDGTWIYTLTVGLSSYDPSVATGVHLIQATYTDLLSPTSDISIVVDTTFTTQLSISYPTSGDSLYNNKPLLRGYNITGNPIDIRLDGVSVGGAIADNSGYWEFKFAFIPNGSRTIVVRDTVTAQMDSVNIFVDTNVAYPLITYIGSELDGFLIMDNLPLIQGVALPNQVVTLYLDYISDVPLGVTQADAFGNWSFRVIPVTYNDPVTGSTVTVAPITNGIHTISTSLINYNVGINVTGYKLNRPNYSQILGVPDNTVFNTRLSPKRMMQARYPLFASMLNKLPNSSIHFQTADKNAELVTTLNGVTVSERANIHRSELGEPIAILENATMSTVALKRFAKVLYEFNNGGYVRGTFRGRDLYFLPIGSMKMKHIADDVQDWKLLLAPINTYSDLLALNREGLTINIMDKSLFHSDYNSLHFVTYDFHPHIKYKHIPLYEDWFENRNDPWTTNPKYVQKYQTSDVIRDQIIANKVSGLRLEMYRCVDARLVATFNYTPVTPAPIAPPEVVLETTITLTDYPEDQYFFVLIAEGEGSGRLTVPFQHEVSTNTFVFTLGGDLIEGEKVVVTLVADGVSTPRIFESVIGPASTIRTVLEDLRDKIIASGFFQTVVLSSNAGYDGLTILSQDTIEGSVVILQTNKRLAISERIETRHDWPKTILIESSHSLNKTGVFFSTGFKTIIRVEGLIKKLQPEVLASSNRDDVGDSRLLHSLISKKRMVRFGTGYGLPDYLYLKIAAALLLDQLRIDNIEYTLQDGQKIEPSDDIDGHPLYYYEVTLDLKNAFKGKVFGTGSTADTEGIVLVVDATAFGLPAASLINIEIKNE